MKWPVQKAERTKARQAKTKAASSWAATSFDTNSAVPALWKAPDSPLLTPCDLPVRLLPLLGPGPVPMAALPSWRQACGL